MLFVHECNEALCLPDKEFRTVSSLDSPASLDLGGKLSQNRKATKNGRRQRHTLFNRTVTNVTVTKLEFSNPDSLHAVHSKEQRAGARKCKVKLKSI